MRFENIDYVANILKCISHKERLKIVCVLINKEKSVNELVKEVGISQSQMSQFLKQLKTNNILDSKKVVLNGAANQYYFIKDEKIKKVIESLKDNYC